MIKSLSKPIYRIKKKSQKACPICKAPFEKKQPVCICHLICDDCGGRIAHHSLGEDPRYPNVSGYFCTTCGPYET